MRYSQDNGPLDNIKNPEDVRSATWSARRERAQKIACLGVIVEVPLATDRGFSLFPFPDISLWCSCLELLRWNLMHCGRWLMVGICYPGSISSSRTIWVVHLPLCWLRNWFLWVNSTLQMRCSQSWENSFCHIWRWHWRFRNLHQSLWPYVCSSLGWLKSMFSWHFALSNLWPAWEIDGVKSYPQQGSFDRQLSFWGDVNDAKELQEIYTLLTENYVEDDDPEGLPGCGQLWWTRVSFGGLHHPIREIFFLLQSLPMLPTFPWSQIWLGKWRNRQQKTGQHVPLRLFDGLLGMGLEAARVFEAVDRGYGHKSNSNTKYLLWRMTLQ